MTSMQKNVVYNAQGETIYAATNPGASTTPTYTVYSNPTPTQGAQSAGLVSDHPSLNDQTAKGKMLRFYNKVETSMRKKWDSSSGPSSRSDPLGGYTVKGPGYYEKKHKITRRVTTRGNPPPMQLANGNQTQAAKNLAYAQPPDYTQSYTPPPLPAQNYPSSIQNPIQSESAPPLSARNSTSYNTTPVYSAPPSGSNYTSTPYYTSSTPYSTSTPIHYATPNAPSILPSGFHTSYATPSVPTH